MSTVVNDNTSSTVQTNTQTNIPSVTTPENTDIVKKAEDSLFQDNTLYTYIFIGVLSVVLILLLYYAYNRFVENSLNEPFSEGNEQERDDPVDDFNLREAIRELQNIQKRVLSTLSENSDI